MKQILLITALFCGAGLNTLSADDGFKPLFDGKTLKGWKSAHSKGEGDWGPFRIDPEQKAIHVYKGDKAGSKQSSDCLYTEKAYSKYILKLEYKWLDKRFAPREDHDRDAGLLFHVHGDLTKVWPLSLEMQIGETPAERMGKKRYHTGDLFVLGKNLRCKTNKTKNIYDPKGPLVPTRSCPTILGVEKPKGEWNEMQIVVDGAKKATFILNGKVVHEIRDMAREVDGKMIPLDKGRIALQAEWAELMYRNIVIKEL
ncbi:3-keto-disaccharide hydrolase [Oceaniferula spumae]